MTTKHHTAKLFIDNSQQHIALRAHDDFLNAITQTDGQINSEDLLFTQPFDIKYHIITHQCVHLCAKGLHFSAFIFYAMRLFAGVIHYLTTLPGVTGQYIIMRSVSAFCRTLSRTISASFRSEVDDVRTQLHPLTLLTNKTAHPLPFVKDHLFYHRRDFVGVSGAELT